MDARKQESLSLTWRDIDLRRAHLTLPQTKNGAPRTLPLVSPALATVQTLARIRRIDGPVTLCLR
jgi:integrase